MTVESRVGLAPKVLTEETAGSERKEDDAPDDSRIALNAQHRAWAFLWGAFAIWCVLVSAGLLSINSWRKTAYSTPPAQLVNKRGIVLYQGPRDSLPVSIAEYTYLDEGAILDVPASSEAILRLGVDNSVVRLRAGSRVRLLSMRDGRFNRELTQVRLEQLQGAAHYTIAGELPDGREVEVKTPNTEGPQDGLRLTKGEYLVWVQPNATRLISYVGQARADANGSVYRLRDAKWIVLGPEPSRTPLDLPEHLIKNRDFSRGSLEAWEPIDIGEKGRPDVGGQRSLVDEVVGGRPTRTLRITRETAKDTHNETGLRQEINRDVWAYRAITLATWVKVNSASLDGGGYAGSEYPVMLRANYIAENGGAYEWVHGFYVKNDSNRPADLGERIEAGVWHRFALDMTKLRDRPAHVISVDVFASGHDFDSQIANVELTVE
jgi:hypothetical protein